MKADAPGEMVEGPGVEQAHGRAEEAGDLGVVTAGVRGARLRVGDGWPATMSPSSSPSSANVGPSPPRPAASARTPVMARPPFGERPSSSKVSSTRRAVLNSLKPSSGCRRIVSPSPMISLDRLSIAAFTLRISSVLVMVVASRGAGLAGRGVERAGAADYERPASSGQAFRAAVGRSRPVGRPDQPE